MKAADDLHFELMQATEEGKDVLAYEEIIRDIQALDPKNPAREEKAAEVLDQIARLPLIEGYAYDEPSDLPGIQAARPEEGKALKLNTAALTEERYYDKVYGAWLGRAAGCLLGQPIEGWHRARIVGLLRETDNYPFQYYISSDIPEEIRQRYDVVDEARVYGGTVRNWINNVQYMPEDDDTNYTLIGLKILEQYGPGFTPEDVGESWLANLPFLHVCTAERVAYKNLVAGMLPPQSAVHRNVYREWIGAQIRADFFGYAAPGQVELAAEMAWRDASISHVKNGIYGEMFVAAMLAAAAVEDKVERVIEYGLSQIPVKSRLTERIRQVLAWHQKGIGWEAALDRIHALYDEKNPHHWCHTVPNAMIVCVALLFGEQNFEKTISMAVLGAFDTDCNGATAGSILGMLLGAKELPDKWIAPLNDQLKSGVDGFGLVKLSDMARRTVDITRSILTY